MCDPFIFGDENSLNNVFVRQSVCLCVSVFKVCDVTYNDKQETLWMLVNLILLFIHSLSISSLFHFLWILADDTKIALHLKDNGGKINHSFSACGFTVSLFED